MEKHQVLTVLVADDEPELLSADRIREGRAVVPPMAPLPEGSQYVASNLYAPCLLWRGSQEK